MKIYKPFPSCVFAVGHYLKIPGDSSPPLICPGSELSLLSDSDETFRLDWMESVRRTGSASPNKRNVSLPTVSCLCFHIYVHSFSTSFKSFAPLRSFSERLLNEPPAGVADVPRRSRKLRDVARVRFCPSAIKSDRKVLCRFPHLLLDPSTTYAEHSLLLGSSESCCCCSPIRCPVLAAQRISFSPFDRRSTASSGRMFVNVPSS